MKHQRILMLGGTGFVGTHLAARLDRQGRQVTVLTRHDRRRHDLWVLPSVRIVQTDVYDEDKLVHELEGHDAVINLVGILNEKGRDGSGFERVHVRLTETVIRACRRAGVKRLLHMGALGSGKGRSHYQRTRAEGERLVQAAGSKDLRTTIFKPSVIFGPGDGFFMRFAFLLRLSPVLPLACPDTRFAPVFVGNVTEAFCRTLDDRNTFGRRYELCGPHVYTLRELVRYAREQKGVRCLIWGLPDWLARLQGRVFDFVPGKPFSTDNYLSLQNDSVCSEDGLTELGIQPLSVEAIVPGYLGRNSRQHRLAAYRSHRENGQA